MTGLRRFAGFVVHDLRLQGRQVAAALGAPSLGRLAAVAAAFVAGLHVALYPAARWLAGKEAAPGGEAMVATLIAGGLALAAPWFVAQAMTALTRALYSRGDFELLLSAPVDVRALFAARALAIAFDAVAAVVLIVAPLADLMAWFGRPHWLALYPLLAAAGLVGAGAGVALALGLFHLVGARRARLVSQVAATAVGAIFVLGGQVLAMLPAGTHDGFDALFRAPGAHSGALRRLAWAPVEAAFGDPGAIIGALAVASLVFAVAVVALGPRFARAAALSAGAPAGESRFAGRAPHFSAKAGAALRAKERRVVWRDPWLMSQLLLQAAYTLPVAAILWRNGGVTGTVGVAFTPALVVIAAQLAGALAWVALSAEDAPDFLRTAPLPRRAVERGKIAAIGQPILAVLALPLGALTWVSPWAGLCAALFGAGAVASAALVNLWRQQPARRGLVLRRHSQSKLVGVMEHGLSILWAVGAAIAVVGSWAALAPLALAALTLALNRRFATAEAVAR